MKKKRLIVFIILFSLTLTSVDNLKTEGQESPVILDNNFIGNWQGKNPVPEFSSTSLANCETLVHCPQKNIHCDHNELYLVQTCDTCARCVNASHIITLKLCLVDGKIQGTVQHSGILNKGTIISQTIFAPNNVVLSIKDNKGKTSTLTLRLEKENKLHGTFSYGLGFNARKLKTTGCG